MANIGVEYFLNSTDLDPADERIEKLAALRNMALNPLRAYHDQFSDSSVVIFLNDVAACPDDILELIHQRVFQSADMTCAMDWVDDNPDPLFYDIWIARGITGDTFFHIPEDGSWGFARNLFWNDEKSRSRLDTFKPFQVFACWNGAVVFTAAPILRDEIKFRASYKDECFQGEPQLFCKDLWALGYSRIAVVPSVNLQYTDETGQRIKEKKGYVSQLIQGEGDDDRIDWQKDPPVQVKCMPSFDNQFFRPWNEGLIAHDLTR
jgi:alpha-1,3-mannosyltransferase